MNSCFQLPAYSIYFLQHSFWSQCSLPWQNIPVHTILSHQSTCQPGGHKHTHLITFSVSVFTQISISKAKWNWAFEWIDWLKVWKNNSTKAVDQAQDIHSHTLISRRFLLNPWELFSHYSVVSETPSIKSFKLLSSSIIKFPHCYMVIIYHQ